jgi:hypothetical protein
VIDPKTQPIKKPGMRFKFGIKKEQLQVPEEVKESESINSSPPISESDDSGEQI